MATAIIAGLLSSGLLKPEQIQCSDIDSARLSALGQRFGIAGVTDNAALVSWADCVIVAVKPQVLSSVMGACAGSFDASKLLVSLCAGVPLSRFSELLPAGVRMIRSMPNTPALVGAGATAISPGPGATGEDMDFADQLFSSVGECVRVAENYLDAVTGLSGSGPAYVMLVIEGLADGGVRAGLPRDVAQKLAIQTVLGGARLVRDTGQHPAQLKDQVTSPGGTTIEGVFALEQGGLRATLMDAVCKAAARAKALGS